MSRAILDKYTDIGITFHLDNGDLKLDAPKGVINTEILSEFNKNKPFLRKVIDQKEQLKHILSSRLNMEVAYDEDYFDLGGSSLQAISVVNDINKTFDTKYTIVDFYNNSTVNKLYDLLTNVVAPESKKIIPIIELLSANHSTEKDTIIFFPPVVGIGKIFKPLANFISRKYNCYAINIPTFGDELRFQEKVTFFFDQIQQQIEHNNKKIILVGYSVGANFAFEIAKLFGNHANIEVVLIDRKIEKIDVTVTTRFIKKTLRAQSHLVETAKQFLSEDDIFEKVTQIIKGLRGYEVSGKIKAPIHTFECDNDAPQNYMHEWSHHTEQFKGVHHLQGDHFQALEEDNLFLLANFFNRVINT